MSMNGASAVAHPVGIKARHGLHERLHSLRPLLLGRAAYLLHHGWRQAVPVALPAVPRARHSHGAPARLMRLLPSLCFTHMHTHLLFVVMKSPRGTTPAKAGL